MVLNKKLNEVLTDMTETREELVEILLGIECDNEFFQQLEKITRNPRLYQQISQSDEIYQRTKKILARKEEKLKVEKIVQKLLAIKDDSEFMDKVKKSMENKENYTLLNDSSEIHARVKGIQERVFMHSIQPSSFKLRMKEKMKEKIPIKMKEKAQNKTLSLQKTESSVDLLSVVKNEFKKNFYEKTYLFVSSNLPNEKVENALLQKIEELN